MELDTRTKDEKRIDHLVRLLKQRDKRISELEEMDRWMCGTVDRLMADLNWCADRCVSAEDRADRLAVIADALAVEYESLIEEYNKLWNFTDSIARKPLQLSVRDRKIAELEAQLADERTDRAGLRQACIENKALRESLSAMTEDRDHAYAENKRLRAGIEAVSGLISESQGVYGLHLNGDPSPWDELLEGGQFEEWLIEFSEANAALKGANDD